MSNKLEYVHTFVKGQELDGHFNNFVNRSLASVCELKNDGPFPHDIDVIFKTNVKVSITIEPLKK